MGVDRGKALADYEALKANAFWQYLLDEYDTRMTSELKVLATTDALADVYRAQGRASVWNTVLSLPEDLVTRLRR